MRPPLATGWHQPDRATVDVRYIRSWMAKRQAFLGAPRRSPPRGERTLTALCLNVRDFTGPVRAPRPGAPAAQSPFARLLDKVQFSFGLERERFLPLKIRENIGADLCGGDRPAEEKTLGLVAVDTVEKGCLLGSLDAFDRHPHVQLAAERDDGFHHRLGFAAGAVEFLHEA